MPSGVRARARLHNKPMALLLTGGGKEEDNAELVVRGFRHLVEYLGGRMVGHLFVSGCTKPEAMDDTVRDRAVQFAAMLDDRTRRGGSPS